jgi:hypothetical protein
MSHVTVRIRDGRTDRDERLVQDDGLGEILAEAEVDRPLRVNDRIRLEDGTELVVIGVCDKPGPERWSQDVPVGEFRDLRPPEPTGSS